MQTIVDRPYFEAIFRAQAMTETQRAIAKKMFVDRNPKAPFGSAPYPNDDAMGGEFSTEDVMPGSRYRGFDPAFSLAKFDTRVDIPYEDQGAFSDAEKAELKKFTEDVLLNPSNGMGTHYFRIDDSLPKPWPSYPLESGPGVAQKIVAQARAFGVSYVEVVEFEKSLDEPRKGVLSMLEAEIAKEHESAVEDASLSAVIPG